MAITYIDGSKPTSSKIQYFDDVADVRERVEPGIMGETSPTGQRLLENALPAASGFAVPGAVKAVSEIPAAIKGFLGNSKSAFLQALAKNPKEFGPDFEAGRSAAGISGQLPMRRGAVARFPKPEMNVPTKSPKPIVDAETLPSVPPVSYPRDTNSFINFARARVKGFGKRLSPQELDDYKTELSNILGSTPPGTPQYAVASQLKTDVTGLHNEAIPGREFVNKAFGMSKTLHPKIPVGGAIKSAAKLAGKLTLATLLGGAGGYGFSSTYNR